MTKASPDINDTLRSEGPEGVRRRQDNIRKYDDGKSGPDPPPNVTANADDDIARLNAVHAVLPIGGKTRVVTFGELAEFPDRKTIVMIQTFRDFASLKNKYAHEY